MTKYHGLSMPEAQATLLKDYIRANDWMFYMGQRNRITNGVDDIEGWNTGFDNFVKHCHPDETITLYRGYNGHKEAEMLEWDNKFSWSLNKHVAVWHASVLGEGTLATLTLTLEELKNLAAFISPFEAEEEVMLMGWKMEEWYYDNTDRFTIEHLDQLDEEYQEMDVETYKVEVE